MSSLQPLAPSIRKSPSGSVNGDKGRPSTGGGHREALTYEEHMKKLDAFTVLCGESQGKQERFAQKFLEDKLGENDITRRSAMTQKLTWNKAAQKVVEFDLLKVEDEILNPELKILKDAGIDFPPEKKLQLWDRSMIRHGPVKFVRIILHLLRQSLHFLPQDHGQLLH